MKRLLPENLFFAVIAIALTVTLPNQAQADNEKWYQLEVVAFTTAKGAEVQEQWRQAPVTMNEEMPESIEATAPSSQTLPDGIVELNKDRFILTGQAYTLSRQRGYRVAVHQSFAIKGMEKDQAPWIDLKSESSALNGKIRLHLSQYLHTNIDFKVRNPDWTANPMLQTNNLGTAVLETSEWVDFKANRRMKIGELHYIDHPLAGLLVKIERFEENKATAE